VGDGAVVVFAGLGLGLGLTLSVPVALANEKGWAPSVCRDVRGAALGRLESATLAVCGLLFGRVAVITQASNAISTSVPPTISATLVPRPPEPSSGPSGGVPNAPPWPPPSASGSSSSAAAQAHCMRRRELRRGSCAADWPRADPGPGPAPTLGTLETGGAGVGLPTGGSSVKRISVGATDGGGVGAADAAGALVSGRSGLYAAARAEDCAAGLAGLTGLTGWYCAGVTGRDSAGRAGESAEGGTEVAAGPGLPARSGLVAGDGWGAAVRESAGSEAAGRSDQESVTWHSPQRCADSLEA
jgi:hypothetical protein